MANESKTEGEKESDEIKKLTNQKGMKGRQGGAVAVAYVYILY